MTTSILPARVARDMNVLAGFLGMRDVAELTPGALEEHLGYPKADVMALFGGSILAGGDVLAKAMSEGVARTYVIVGGAGHTTETFRAKVRALEPGLAFPDDASEAEVFDAYLEKRYHLRADLLEKASTNCGNNVTYLLALLAERGIPTRSVILSQDATMQRRMMAEMAKESPDTDAVAFATYAATVMARGDALLYEETPLGMWDIGRYLTLLMGEIPRLTDDERGYGPRGAAYLAHVDIPGEVRAAWDELRVAYPDSVRTADPSFAS